MVQNSAYRLTAFSFNYPLNYEEENHRYMEVSYV